MCMCVCVCVREQFWPSCTLAHGLLGDPIAPPRQAANVHGFAAVVVFFSTRDVNRIHPDNGEANPHPSKSQEKSEKYHNGEGQLPRPSTHLPLVGGADLNTVSLPWPSTRAARDQKHRNTATALW